MRRTKYELTGLRNTVTGIESPLRVYLPMNVPLMLVRTKGNRLGFKRLKQPERPKTQRAVPAGQVSLL